MPNLIYIGSPYSHESKAVMEENFRRVTKFAAELCSQGKVAFSPITYGHTLLEYKEMSSAWEFWQNFCLTFLKHADKLIVYKMPGWDKSRGLAAEIEFAKEHMIPVEYIEFDEAIVSEVDAYDLVNSCETAEDLSAAIKRLAVGGEIRGRKRTFSADKMASYVAGVINGTLPPNLLTRNYGIRQQAIYIKVSQDSKRLV
jgi:hypothetical protein